MEFLSQRLKTRPISILAVSVDDSWSVIDDFFGALKLKPSFLVFLDKGKKLSEHFGASKFPETFLVDKRGQVLRSWIGAVDWSIPEVWREIDQIISKN